MASQTTTTVASANPFELHLKKLAGQSQGRGGQTGCRKTTKCDHHDHGKDVPCCSDMMDVDSPMTAVERRLYKLTCRIQRERAKLEQKTRLRPGPMSLDTDEEMGVARPLPPPRPRRCTSKPAPRNSYNHIVHKKGARRHHAQGASAGPAPGKMNHASHSKGGFHGAPKGRHPEHGYRPQGPGTYYRGRQAFSGFRRR